jgi:L-threonylcarbamoyladenylate synthase
VRVSSHPVTRALVERLGRPMTSTSANAPGAAPALTAHEALAAAAGGADLWALDAGRLPPSAPSTVIDCTGAQPVVVRAGATPLERLRCVLPGIHGAR